MRSMIEGRWSNIRRLTLIAVIAVSLLLTAQYESTWGGTDERSPQTSTGQFQKGNNKKDKKKNRKLVPPKDQEAMALFMQLLERNAMNIEPRAEMDRRLEQAIARKPSLRKTVNHLVGLYHKLSPGDRQYLLGSYSGIVPEKTISKDRYMAAFRQSAKSRRSIPKLKPEPIDPDEAKPDKFPGKAEKEFQKDLWENRLINSSSLLRWAKPLWGYGPGPALPPGVVLASTLGSPFQQEEYRLTYTGLRCYEETWGTGSDEAFVITTVFDSDGNTWTTKHPRGGEYDRNSTYEADDGNLFRGPNRNVWHSNQGGGGAKDLTLVVSVWEEDSVDPEETEEDIQGLIDIARAEFCGESGEDCDDWVEFVFDAAEFVVDNMLGLENDLLGTVERRIAAADIPMYVTEADRDHRLRTHQRNDTGVRYHFSTRHNDDADYRVFFRFNREPRE